MADETQVDPLGMTDEDFLNQPMPTDEPIQEEEVDTKEEEPVEQEQEQEEVEQESEEESNESEQSPEISEDSGQDNFTDSTTSDSEPEQATGKKKKATKSTKTDSEEEAPVDIDYKAEYEKILAPFNANNKQIQVSSVEDALNLMKMGANYNKKMSGLKPNMKFLKMLENNGLLDEEKLNHLIDLDKKDPAAIANFIKTSGVDPLDIDTEAEDNYKPNTYNVNDKEVELDTVLDDIRDTDSFKDTIDVISNKLDEPSKKILLENPSIIGTINGHMESGIYGQIMHVVENEKMMGRLTEMSDLQAYKHVGDTIQRNGGFNQPAQPTGTTPTDTKVAEKEAKRTAKKKAAGSTSGTKASSKKADFNPLSMSDEEFEKATAGTYI